MEENNVVKNDYKIIDVKAEKRIDYDGKEVIAMAFFLESESLDGENKHVYSTLKISINEVFMKYFPKELEKANVDIQYTLDEHFVGNRLK